MGMFAPGSLSLLPLGDSTIIGRGRCGVLPGPDDANLRNPVMAKHAPAMPKTTSSDWDRDAALTTARILLEIQAINFRPEEPYTFSSGW
jgi:hypothetical protein